MKTQFNTLREKLVSEEWESYQASPLNSYYKINSQQLSKTPILLDCLVAPEGRTLVQLDFAALEPNVLANYSGDATYKEIYNSGKPHGIYLYVVCKLLDPDGEVSEVYNIDNPTEESVAKAKKKFKTKRTIGKVFHLMATYKAGAAKIHRKLGIMNIDLTRDEVNKIRERYWGPELFGGIVEYENSLLAEVAQNDGWIANGLGRPFAVTERKHKDILNLTVQSSGHDYTDLYILYVEQEFEKRGVGAIPVVSDYHDETIWSVPNEETDRARECMVEALATLNKAIDLEIPLKGDPEITKDFTGFKGPDVVDFYNGRDK